MMALAIIINHKIKNIADEQLLNPIFVVLRYLSDCVPLDVVFCDVPEDHITYL